MNLQIIKLVKTEPQMKKFLQKNEAFFTSQQLSQIKTIFEEFKFEKLLFNQIFCQETFVGFCILISDDVATHILFLNTFKQFQLRGLGGQSLKKLSYIFSNKQLSLNVALQQDVELRINYNKKTVSNGWLFFRQGFLKTNYFINWGNVNWEVWTDTTNFNNKFLNDIFIDVKKDNN